MLFDLLNLFTSFVIFILFDFILFFVPFFNNERNN